MEVSYPLMATLARLPARVMQPAARIPVIYFKEENKDNVGKAHIILFC
jgi:hypothetical protein